MDPAVEGLEWLGRESLGLLWLPMAAWTTVALAALAGLHRWRRGHPLVHYMSRGALLAALPLGLLLSAAGLSPLRFLLAGMPLSAGLTGPLLPLAAVRAGAAGAPLSAWLLGLGLLTSVAGLVALGQTVRLAVQVGTLARLRNSPLLAPAPPALERVLRRHLEEMGLRRRVELLVSALETAPLTFGCWRPVLVLPASLVEEGAALHLALSHELIHVRRHDCLVQRAELLLGALFGLNPVVALLRRSIAAYRELSCDAELLSRPRVNRKLYAELLVRFADAPPPAPRALLGMNAANHHLKQRIYAMNDPVLSPRAPFTPRAVGLALGVLLLSAAAFTASCTEVVDSGGEAAARAASMPQDAEVFVVVEEMPRIAGGLKAFQQSLTYPEAARKAGQEGRVLVEFVVDEEGRVVAPTVVEGVGGDLDEEALRAVREAKFIPGRQHGKAVPVRMSMPILFELPAGGDR